MVNAFRGGRVGLVGWNVAKGFASFNHRLLPVSTRGRTLSSAQRRAPAGHGTVYLAQLCFKLECQMPCVVTRL